MRIIALILILLVAAPPAVVYAQRMDPAMDRAVAAYAAVKTMRGTFEQTLTNPKTGTAMTARGDFQHQLPNRISIRFLEPKESAADRIVGDGTSVWLYVPSAFPGLAMKAPVGAVSGGVDLLGQLLTNPEERYTVTPVPAADSARAGSKALLLVPRSPDAAFTKATIWVDNADGLVRQFEVTEALGLVRRIRLLTLRTNVAVDSAAFRFTAPAGVQVRDANGMMVPR